MIITAFEVFKEMLEILPVSGNVNDNPDWLVGTENWQLGFSIKCDLFKFFIEKMVELAKQGYFEIDETYNRAIEYVQGLKRLRDDLHI